MQTITNGAAQGDVLFLRVDTIPNNYSRPLKPEGERYILAHSETGHHHYTDMTGCQVFSPETADPFTCYLRVEAEDGIAITHGRAWDTHESFRLSKGLWMVRRQREYTPQGFRRVED